MFWLIWRWLLGCCISYTHVHKETSLKTVIASRLVETLTCMKLLPSGLKYSCPTGRVINSQMFLSAIGWNEETLNLPPRRCGNRCASPSVCWCSQRAKRSQIGLPTRATGRTLVVKLSSFISPFLWWELGSSGPASRIHSSQYTWLLLTHRLNLFSVTMQPKS